MSIDNSIANASSGISKRDYWREHIKRWQSSKLKQEAYCKQSGINYNSFVYWRGVFLGELTPKQNKTQFIPVKLSTSPSQIEAPRAIQIRLTSGHQVYLPLTMKLDDIACLLKALGTPYA